MSTPEPTTEGLFEIILDSITEGVFTVDPEMRVLSFNKAAEAITGVSARDALGRPCREVLGASVCGEGCPLKRSMRTGEPSLEMDVDIATADGGSKPVRIRTAVLTDERGGVRGGVETFRDLSQEQHLIKRLTGSYTFCDIKGKSKAMRRLFALLPEVARSRAGVLVTGESGTGKELVARALHDLSPRAEGPFVPVNCGSLPDTLLESELFGHRRGAFTGADRDRPGRFAAARGGTIFLDEIGEISQALQVRLLRVLDRGEYVPLGDNLPQKTDARVVAATNRDLRQEMDAGNFRQDLYYRLNVVEVHLPPLRRRRVDIPLLVEHFLQTLAAERGEPVRTISSQAMALIMDHDWPGNVRELKNALEHALVLAPGPELRPEDLPEFVRGAVDRRAVTPGPGLELAQRERQAIVQALRACSGHRLRTAEALGISTTTLWRRMKRYGIS